MSNISIPVDFNTHTHTRETGHEALPSNNLGSLKFTPKPQGYFQREQQKLQRALASVQIGVGPLLEIIYTVC